MIDLYVDCAIRPDVEPLLAIGLFRGVTTNPLILDRAGLTADDIPSVYEWAIQAGAQEVFVQTWGADTTEMVERSQRLCQIGDRVIIKVPVSRHGIAAASQLVEDGVRVLLTAVHATHQAVVAAAIGVEFLAPYVGRIEDGGGDGTAAVVTMRDILGATGSNSRILAASIRDISDVIFLSKRGIDAFALPVAVAEQLLADDGTRHAIAGFERVTDTWQA